MEPDLPGARFPAVAYDRLRWQAESQWGSMTRRERETAFGSYRSAITPQIAATSWAPSRRVSAAAEDAANEIARFDQEIGADGSPLAAVLLRTESAASSQIENLTASAGAIAMADIGDTSRRNAALIAANTTAMLAAIELAEHLNEGTVLKMHDALLGDHDPDIAGRWRQQPVWIGVSSRTPIGADYVAPRHDLVPGAMVDLTAYMNRNDIPLIEQTAIAHAQFETIHPFPDGNGRVGRALMHAMLRNKGLTRTTTVPISAGLLADVPAYHQALTDYRTGDPEPIIERTADAAFRAVTNGRALVADLHRIRNGWSQRVNVRRDSATWRVADLLLRRPVINTRILAKDLGITANHAGRYLDPLQAAGVVTAFSGYRRGLHWRADEVLDALDAFAARSRRGR